MRIFRKKGKQEKENFGSVLRLIEGRSIKHADGKYKRNYQVRDNATGEVLLESDLHERDIYSELVMTDDKKQIWKIKPNRKIMPLRWHIYSPEGKKSSEIRFPGFFTMMNPLSRKYLRITDFQKNRKLIYIDLDSGLLDRFFGSSPSTWSITENKKVVAKVSYLAKEEEQEEEEKPKKKGFLSKLKKWFKGSDQALQSYSSEPVINAQTFLALTLINNDVTSGSVE